MTNGGTKVGLTLDDVRRLVVFLPPLDEQAAIVISIERQTGGLNAAISRLEREIELLREYRARLIADVVMGKLDVREAAARLPDESLMDTIGSDTDQGDETEVADEEVAV